MKLRVVNPAFIEAMQRRGIDIKKASRDDMRSYVCGQCHVEYYFEPDSKKVVFPWDKSLLPEQMYAYYQEKPTGFNQDWLHPDSQAKMLKAQHPDFETWSGGVHGKSGISCADCHMPYLRKQGQKYTSHWVTSPMRLTKESCMPCHTQSEAWLLERVKTIQNNTWQLQRTAGQTVAKAHEVIGKAGAVTKANRAELDKARELVERPSGSGTSSPLKTAWGFIIRIRFSTPLAGPSIWPIRQLLLPIGRREHRFRAGQGMPLPGMVMT
jgi:nitrite reductase (cytochrome c-552)